MQKKKKRITGKNFNYKFQIYHLKNKINNKY